MKCMEYRDNEPLKRSLVNELLKVSMLKEKMNVPMVMIVILVNNIEIIRLYIQRLICFYE